MFLSVGSSLQLPPELPTLASSHSQRCQQKSVMHLPQRTEYLGSSTSFLFLKLSSLSYLCSSFLFQLSKACELILCIKSSPLLEMFRVGFVFLTGPPCSVQNATVGLTNAAKREKQNANTLIFLFLYIICSTNKYLLSISVQR